ncbi:MAG: hypothetical protein ABIP13_04745 [Tepidiformaceae bacterium]
MQPVKKVMLVLGAPLALAAMAGGAVAFAGQSGGAESARPHSSTHVRFEQAGNQAPGGGDGDGDGTGCPNDKGTGSSEGSVSPAVY